MWKEIQVERVAGTLQDVFEIVAMESTSEVSENHPLIQVDWEERLGRQVDTLAVPGFLQPPFPHHPSPNIFIAHLLCLAQMMDSASWFFFFFNGESCFEPCFVHLSVQTPWISYQLLSGGLSDQWDFRGSLGMTKSKLLKETGSNLCKEWLFPFKNTKEQR